MRTTRLVLAMHSAWLIAILAPRGSAQSSPPPTDTRLSLSAGFAWDDRRDDTASPLRFGGRGWSAALGYDRLVMNYSTLGWLDGGEQSLTSGATQSTERLSSGALDVMLLRHVGAPASSRRIDLGLDVRTSLAITSHRYADPSLPSTTFAFGLFALGPAASVRQEIGGGVARASVSTPAIAWVDHPYSEIRSATSRVQMRFASITRLRAVDVGFSYAGNERRRIGVTYAYRLGVLRYDDVQPVRSITQTLSIGVTARLGRGSR